MGLAVTHSGHEGPGTNGPNPPLNVRHSTNLHNLKGCAERGNTISFWKTWAGHELIRVGHWLDLGWYGLDMGWYDITLPAKVHLVKPMVFSVVIYGCESWTIKKAEHWRIDAFELWCWRRLLRVPWTAGRYAITSDMQMIPPYSRKQSRTKESLDESERGEWKSWLKTQHQ